MRLPVASWMMTNVAEKQALDGSSLVISKDSLAEWSKVLASGASP